MYFNLLEMLFEQSVNVTVWTVGNANSLSFHFTFTQYKEGYGIISLQATHANKKSVCLQIFLS